MDSFEEVYEVVKLIPKGRVSTYGAIASYLGTAPRLVGWALNKPHEAIPAHRVVNRNGVLTGKAHFGSPTAMEELLNAEDIQVKNDQVVNFFKLFWDPGRELL